MENSLKTSTNSIINKCQSLVLLKSSPSSSSSMKLLDNDIYSEQYYKYYDKVVSASKQNKIFTIQGYYPIIRKGLLKRGWIEKSIPEYLKPLRILSLNTLIKNAKSDNIYETLILAKLANKFPTNFIWQPIINNNNDKINHLDIMPYRNHIQRSKMYNFTKKEGLIGCIEKSHWNIINDLSDIQAPRLHRLENIKGQLQFLQDYRTTYCLSLLNYISDNKNSINLFSQYGTISLAVIEFAIARIKSEITIKENYDLSNNKNYECNEQFNDINDKWKYFYTIVNDLINNKEKLLSNDETEITNYINMCKNIINKATVYWSHILADGYHNLWILKPLISNHGKGIIIMKDINNIMNFIKKHHKIKYLAQKYIERPLLIYNTKFDIRQYVLLTITETRFNIWIYNDCYLQFSTKEYQLDNLNKSIHITRNFQQNLNINNKRNNKLPKQNMWSLNQFQKYLHIINKNDVWLNKIFPLMKYNIIAIILSSLEETKFIPNSFELYESDFILDELYRPILIEINSLPYLSNSTNVSEKICTAALDDLMKIVIDSDSTKSNYELIYSLDWINPLNDINSVKDDDQKLIIPQVLFDKPIKNPNFNSYKISFKNQTSDIKKKMLRFKSPLV